MVMAALVNRLLANRLQGYLACTLQATLEPVMAMEEFNAGAPQTTPRARARRGIHHWIRHSSRRLPAAVRSRA